MIRLAPTAIAHRLLSDRLLRYSAIYLTGTVVAGGFGYVFHFAAGRLLGPTQYAVVASAVAALYLVTLPALVLQTVSARFTSVAAGTRQAGNVPGLVLQLSLLGLAVGAPIGIALLVFAAPVSSFLQISDQRVMAFLILASLAALLVATTRGALQGLQRFVALSLNVSLDMATRVAVLVGLVLAGAGTVGGVIALSAGPAIAYMQSFWLLRGLGKEGSHSRASMRQVGRYAALASVGAMGTTYLYNVDVILSKHYLIASAAGIYAAASVLGRVVYFLGLTVAQVMFPEVATLHARNEPHYHVVDQSLGLVAVIAIGLTLLYRVVPGLIVLPFGPAFAQVQSYLWPFAIALGLLAIVNLLINYFLSISSARFVGPLVAACVVETVLIVVFHSGPAQILTMVVIAMGVLAAALLVLYGVDRLGYRRRPA